MEKEFEQYVMSKIEEIHESKKGKVEPDFVLYVELANAVTGDTIKMLKDTLNKFYKEKRYKIGKTLNDRYIENEKWHSND